MPSSSSASSSTRSRATIALRVLSPADRGDLERILRTTGVFSAGEIDVALELIDAPASVGYRFFVAEFADGTEAAHTEMRVAGYACFGETPLTDGTWDLYWIAVDPACHGRGVGRVLMQAVEDEIRSVGGRLLLIETASKPSYDATRRFYLTWGCREVARVPDFYAVGDDKIVYARDLKRDLTT